MFKLLPACVAMMGILFTAMPLHAQQGGDMFGGSPKSSTGQPDMFPSQTPEAPASDVFHDQPAAPAPDMFPQQTPGAPPSADMFDGAAKGNNSGNQDVFPAHAPQAPSDALYHNPNANGP